MEKAKAVRKVARRRFTMCIEKLTTLLSGDDLDGITAEYSKLSLLYEELSSVQNKVIDLLLDNPDHDENAVNQEVDISDTYVDEWYKIKQAVSKLLGQERSASKKDFKDCETEASSKSRAEQRCYRLPKLELPKFNGEVKSWISFWSQFSKIHTDPIIDLDDKFQYLLQCMELGSPARELVQSYPPSGENYSKVMDQLKERFAKDEVITEHYVRELLNLVLAQAKGMTQGSLRCLYDKLMTQIMALETLGISQVKYEAFLLPLVESALPDEILKAWSRSHARSVEEGSLLSKLLNFIKLEVESDERIKLARSGFNNEGAIPSTSCFMTAKSSKVPEKNQKNSQTKAEKQCIWCEKTSHTSSECYVPMKMSLDERRDFLKNKRACFNCLNIGHSAKFCRRFLKCLFCNKRHYAIMCGDVKPATSDNSKEKKNTSENTDIALHESNTRNETVLLQTLRVKVITEDGEHIVRALLDSGAQSSFIKSDLADYLKLKAKKEKEISHIVFGGTLTEKRLHRIFDLNIRSLDNNFQCTIEVVEQKKLCGYLPNPKKGSILSQLENEGIFLTDCDDNSEICILIGSNVLGLLHTGRSVHVDENLLAVETKLGWTLQGPVVGMYCNFNYLNVLHCEFNVEDFWKLETIGIKDQSEVKSQKILQSEVTDFFKSTISITNDDRYEVRLPWKDSAKILQPNYHLALKRLKCTTARVKKLNILQQYSEVFDEWVKDEIIEEVEEDNPTIGHYMPHHAVVKENSLTTKIRPVFDASALDANGFSLNSCLEKGSNLIELIPKLLLQFRRNAIGITSDIKKAFLQISLHPDDRNYLKFLWWRNIHTDDKKIITYRHSRVVFGVTTSPFLLSATILHHLEKYDNNTAAILRKSFYVDNCIVSMKNINEMNQFITESKKIMMDGKFDLRCWVTGPIITDKEIVDTSVLGITWNTQRDDLRCKIPIIKDCGTLTKRSVLSIAQSVFDPIGFVCPTTIIPKLIMQKCWMINLNWDEKLPDDLHKSMHDWLKQKSSIDMCRIPRRLSQMDLDVSVNTLHVFSDASVSAYACCIFLRSEYNEEVSVQLVLAKSRVAPTKLITIPRLELIAALMATRLANEAKEGLAIKCKEYYWTDSSITLAWLKKKESLNCFVYNRVKEILERTNVQDWNHIPGELNPADLPSRGCSPDKLLNSRWWEGPAWLAKAKTEWPHTENIPDEDEVKKEIKKCCYSMQEVEKFSERLKYFNKYSRIVRQVGWCLRFVNNCREKLNKRKGNLSVSEFENAERKLVIILQEEDKNIVNREAIKLDTFCDADGIIKVKTRLTLSNDTESFMSPTLLSSKNYIVERLVLETHIKALHAGSQSLLNILREKYWIIGARRLVKRVVYKCVICRRYSTKGCNVPSAPLPFNRVNCGAAFDVTGIDLAGPLLLRSGNKCWVVLFTCATYRAIHLELCTSLSTEDFMLALRRFIARRGRVKVIYSDNATNFHGANKLFDNINWQEIANNANIKKIEWRFIPPSAPWWGGFWERMIKTVKDILRRVLGKAFLQYAELLTVLCEVEAMVNARPLTYVSDSTENVKTLTPSMFLRVDNPNDEIPETELINGDILTSRWRYIQKLNADLKTRFRNEYLSLLVQRNNKIALNNIKVGDVVLIGFVDRKRVHWPLGLVIEIYVGVDGHSRVARLKTATGERIRPLQRLYPLEVSCSDPVLFEKVRNRCGSQSSPGVDDLCEQPKTTSSPHVTRTGRLIKLPERLNL